MLLASTGVNFLSVVCSLFGVGCLALLLRGKSLGVLRLDADHLEVGPEKRTRRIPLSDVTGASRMTEVSMIADERERLLVHFHDRETKAGGVGLAVALLDPHDADEVTTRIQLRKLARQFDDPRALEALEALHEMGKSAIGAHLTAEGWRPFFSVRELDKLGGHPFRDQERIPVCLRSDVWDAFQSAVPEVAKRLELVAVFT
jgi:hypothetical protein